MAAPRGIDRIDIERLVTCDNRLQLLFLRVALRANVRVACGHRGEAEQTAAVAAGTSKAPWPTSAHNSMPSRAIDVYPLPIPVDDMKPWFNLARIVKEEAASMGISLKWGGPDGDRLEWDSPHWELLD